MSNPYRPTFAGAWVRLEIEWEPSTFGGALVLADAATREAALDAVQIGGDVAEIERLTQCKPGALERHTWRELSRVAAQFTTGEGRDRPDATRAFVGVNALTSIDEDDCNAGKARS